jgi:hypothetical protein
MADITQSAGRRLGYRRGTRRNIHAGAAQRRLQVLVFAGIADHRLARPQPLRLLGQQRHLAVGVSASIS